MNKLITKITILVFALSMLGTANSYAQDSKTKFEQIQQSEELTKQMVLFFKAVDLGLNEEAKKIVSEVDDVDSKYKPYNHEPHNITNSGITFLHYASDKDNLELVKYLVENGANINAQENDGKTPLHKALSYRYKDVAIYLIEKGASPSISDVFGVIPAHLIARNCYEGLLNKFEEDSNEWIGKKDNLGNAPFAEAIKSSCVKVADELFLMGSNINTQNYDLQTPLHHASERGYQFDIVEYLIDHKAEINLKDISDDTPLHLAAQYGYLETAKLLIDNGADVDIVNFLGYTSFQVASKYGKEKVADYITSKRKSAMQRILNDIHYAIENR